MQIYLTISGWTQFSILWLIGCAYLAYRAFAPGIKMTIQDDQREKEYQRFYKEEDYWQSIRNGTGEARNHEDLHKAKTMSQGDWKLFTAHLWDDSKFFKDWRWGKLWQQEGNKKFERTPNGTRVGEELFEDDIQYL